jgi:hypothetical protein
MAVRVTLNISPGMKKWLPRLFDLFLLLGVGVCVALVSAGSRPAKETKAIAPAAVTVSATVPLVAGAPVPTAVDQARQEQEVLQIVRDYYRALESGDCPRAIELRPGYDNCKKLAKATIHFLEVVHFEPQKQAVLQLAVSFGTADGLPVFKGYVMLRWREGDWRIAHRSFNQQLNFSEYLKWISTVPDK